MPARVAGENRFQSSQCLILGGRRVGEQVLQSLRHLAMIASEEKVPFAKELLSIAPRRRNKRYPACQRLEHTYRWYARHGARVLLARDMNCKLRRGVRCRRVKVGKIPCIGYSRIAQRLQCALRITHAVNDKVPVAEARSRAQEEFPDLRRAL